MGAMFYGDNGSLLITGSNAYTVYDLKNKVVKDVQSNIAIDPRNLMNPAEQLDALHIQNFFNAIRKSEPLHSDIASGHKSTLLVQLGNIAQLIVLMKDAFQEALVCTNDPECLNNVPAGNNSNGAACHSCCMISETACENGNRMLDRGLIVPIDGRENQSYFKTLVEELCQLEV